MSIRTLVQTTLCGVIALLPAGSLFGMPFLYPPAQESPWQEVWFTPTLVESTLAEMIERQQEIPSPPSPFDTLSFGGELRSLNTKDRGLDPIDVSSKGEGQLLSGAFADTGRKQARQAKWALDSGHSLEAWRAALEEMALDETAGNSSRHDAKERYPLVLFLAGLLLITVGAIVRRVRRPSAQREEPTLVSKPAFPVWSEGSAIDGRVRVNNYAKASIPSFESERQDLHIT
jgi:hypothetical protein